MAKKKNNKSAKSLIMLVATGLTLVVATLCWFSIMDRSEIEKLDNVIVKNENSSKAKIYYGADENGKIAIRPEDITQYLPVKDDLILLENMFPGAEYTYIAEFYYADKDKKITLDLEGVRNDTDSTLMSSVKLNRRVSLMNDTTETNKYTVAEIYLDKEDEKPFEYTIETSGKHRIYFSFKIEEETTIDKKNMSIIIDHIDAVIE